MYQKYRIPYIQRNNSFINVYCDMMIFFVLFMGIPFILFDDILFFFINRRLIYFGFLALIIFILRELLAF